MVHAANVHDTKTGIAVTESAAMEYHGLCEFCGIAGYRSTFEREVGETLNLRVDICERISGKGWKILPRLRVVERTFSWLNHSRGLSKDYDITKSYAENLIKIAHSHTLFKRLCKRILTLNTRERLAVDIIQS